MIDEHYNEEKTLEICKHFQEKWAREEEIDKELGIIRDYAFSPTIFPALGDACIEPPSTPLTCTYINVNGREEDEKILKDAEKCKELGLDQIFETLVYLKRWGTWLDGSSTSS